MKTTEEPIVIEQTFEASIKTVWKAITELEQMQKWYFEQISAFSPVEGFETQFTVHVNDKSFHHMWKVTEVSTNRKISYKWKYSGIPGDSVLTFELSDFKNGAKLKIEHRVIEDFPEGVPEFSRESGIAGGTYFIKESLKSFLDGKLSVTAGGKMIDGIYEIK